MITTVRNISSLNSSKIQSNDPYFKIKQFSRTYPGGYSINFVDCLSAINSAKTKHYSNFYLTNEYRYSDIVAQPLDSVKMPYIHGPIMYGDTFLKFSDIDPRPYSKEDRFDEAANYGVGIFSKTYDTFCDFTLSIKIKNKCQLHFTKDYKEYYLCADIDNNLIFVKKSLLDFNANGIRPQDFDYVYSPDSNYIFFYKKTPTGEYSVINDNNTLRLQRLVAGDLITNTKSPFKLSKNIYDTKQIIPNNSYITYKGNNSIDSSKSDFNLSNNLLIHKKFMDNDSGIDILVLKNTILDNNTHSSANNLLSGGNSRIYVNGLREYTNILQDINSEESEALELNYVHYNTTYRIKGGDNIFTSPSSMFPFDKLNINDTKFIESGSFGYVAPEYADKVYCLSNDTTLNTYNQHLLCTWLSGSSNSENKIWVDRYYYPDLIEKRDALAGIGELSIPTYDDYIESLIYETPEVYESCDKKMFFDKKSDLVFEPNRQYVYTRSTYIDDSPISSYIYDSMHEKFNYFRDINNSGELSISFSFIGDGSNWEFYSDVNNIKSGLTFSKQGYELTIRYYVYDSTTFEYDDSENSWIRHEKTVSIEPLKSNFVSVGIDTKNNTSYFFVNNVIVDIFNLPAYQIYIKQLLHGDFHLYYDNKKLKAGVVNPYISNMVILDKYVPVDFVNTFNLTTNIDKLNDIYITLPCGMVNGLDSVEIMNSICGASTFKSNYIDINIKNLNINSNDILEGLSKSIRSNIVDAMPTNATIKNINYPNYKK